MNNKSIANEWFIFADNDLKSAKFLLHMNPLPLEIICYHCQQSAEKYLKGYISLNGGKLIKTHDLTLLNKVCIEYDIDFQEMEDDTIELEEHDVKKAIESAERIKNFVLNKAK